MNGTDAAYRAAVSYLNDTPRFTEKHTLNETKQMLAALGHPEEHFRIIHAAGSNGKGSVCVMTDAILRAAGIKSALFTSPHLVTTRERFVIDGRMVTEAEFLDDFRDVTGMLEKNPSFPHPTYFEFLFLMAMIRFRKAGVQAAVVETGLGGRLDATNAVKNPALTVITSISLEHTQYLGNTICEVAAEKAGIIKPGVGVVFDGNDPEAASVIRRAALQQQSPAFEIRREMLHGVAGTQSGYAFLYEGMNGTYRLQVPSQAQYQVMNAALAACTAEHFLKENQTVMTPKQIRTAVEAGILHMHFPGRMEEKADGIILDGAHNPAGIDAFVRSAGAMTVGGNILLFACMDDKNYGDMIKKLGACGLWDLVIVTGTDSPRAAQPKKLEALFKAHTDAAVRCIPDPGEALEAARACRRKGGRIFAVGSLYLIGDLENRL